MANPTPKLDQIRALAAANYEAEQARQKADRDMLRDIKKLRGDVKPDTLTPAHVRIGKLQAQINAIPVKRAPKPKKGLKR